MIWEHFTECPECRAILSWNLIGACASIGIERKKSTEQMVTEFMTAFHEKHSIWAPR